MKIRPTASAEDILKLDSSRQLLKKIVRAALFLLKKYFGSEIMVEVPYGLQNTEKELLPAITIASKIDLPGNIKTDRIARFPDEPFIFAYNSSVNFRIQSSGADFFSEKRAYWKSMAEAIERYTWRNSDEFYKSKVKYSSCRELGDKALDLNSLAGFSPDQKTTFPILSWNSDTVFGWIKARSLTAKKDIFCPLQLVSAHYFTRKVKGMRDASKDEPMLRWIITTGLATGKNLEETILKGALEVIERDAFMVTYLNKISPPKFDLDELAEQDDDLRKILRSFKKYHLEVNLVKMLTDLPVHATLAIVIDRSGSKPALTVGARASFDLKTSILDALAECLSCRLETRVNLGMELDEIIDLKKPNRLGRIFYWSKPENLSQIDFLLKGEKVAADLPRNTNFFAKEQSDLPRKYYQKRLRFLTHVLRRRGMDLLYVELTTAEMRKFGLRCVQAVIPQMQPMHLDETIPYFGGRRLKDVPLALRYTPEEKPNPIPHPFP